MSNKYNGILYTFTFAALGAAIVGTKFFTDYSAPWAVPLTVALVAGGITSVASLIGALAPRRIVRLSANLTRASMMSGVTLSAWKIR